MYIPGMKEPTTQARAYQNTAKSYAFLSCFLSIVHKGQWLNCFDFFTGDSILPGNGRSKILDIVVVWSYTHTHAHTHTIVACALATYSCQDSLCENKENHIGGGRCQKPFFLKRGDESSQVYESVLLTFVPTCVCN